MADELVELDEFDDDEPSDEEERLALNMRIDAIESRCKARDVTFDRGVDEDGDSYATIMLDDKVDSRSIRVISSDRAKRILEITFEEYKFVCGYEGICNYSLGLVEIALRSSFLTTGIEFRKLSKVLGE